MRVFRPYASAVDGLVIHKISDVIVLSRMRGMVTMEKLLKCVKGMKRMVMLLRRRRLVKVPNPLLTMDYGCW